MTVAANAAFVLTLYLGWRLLPGVRVAARTGDLFLTAFGSPLFYYVVFEPSSKHAVDTLVITAASLLTAETSSRRDGPAGDRAGALAGLFGEHSLRQRRVLPRDRV